MPLGPIGLLGLFALSLAVLDVGLGQEIVPWMVSPVMNAREFLMKKTFVMAQ